MPNWKAPGPDNAQDYWLKNLTGVVLTCWQSSGWQTVLKQKDKSKGNIANKY